MERTSPRNVQRLRRLIRRMTIPRRHQTLPIAHTKIRLRRRRLLPHLPLQRVNVRQRLHRRIRQRIHRQIRRPIPQHLLERPKHMLTIRRTTDPEEHVIIQLVLQLPNHLPIRPKRPIMHEQQLAPPALHRIHILLRPPITVHRTPPRERMTIQLLHRQPRRRRTNMRQERRRTNHRRHIPHIIIRPRRMQRPIHPRLLAHTPIIPPHPPPIPVQRLLALLRVHALMNQAMLRLVQKLGQPDRRAMVRNETTHANTPPQANNEYVWPSHLGENTPGRSRNSYHGEAT